MNGKTLIQIIFFMVGMVNIAIGAVLYDFYVWIDSGNSYFEYGKKYEKITNLYKVNTVKIQPTKHTDKYILSSHSIVDVVIYEGNKKNTINNLKISNLKYFINKDVKKIDIIFDHNNKEKKITLNKKDIDKMFKK